MPWLCFHQRAFFTNNAGVPKTACVEEIRLSSCSWTTACLARSLPPAFGFGGRHERLFKRAGHRKLVHLLSAPFRLSMADQRQATADVDIDDCSLYGSWIWSVLGAAISIPVGIKKKSLAPLVFYGSTGAMLDIWVGLSNCERAKQEQVNARLVEDRLSQESHGGDPSLSEEKVY